LTSAENIVIKTIEGLANLMKENGTEYTPGNGDPDAPPWLVPSISANFREIVMRSSTDPKRFPGPNNGAKLGNPPTGSTVRADTIAKRLPEPGTGSFIEASDLNVVSDYNAYRNVHAVKGHAVLSEAGNILVSYYVWGKKRCPLTQDLCPNVEPDLYYSASAAGAANNSMPPINGTQVNAVSSFRTMKFPLKYVYPWCAMQNPTSTCPP
jgi:hypothetical protein